MIPKKNNFYKKTKYVLFILIFTLFLQNIIFTADADEIILDNSGNSFSGHIYWPEFMQDCGEDNYIDTGGELQDIQANIIFDFDKGKISGTISGKHVDEQYAFVYKEAHTAQITFARAVETLMLASVFTWSIDVKLIPEITGKPKTKL